MLPSFSSALTRYRVATLLALPLLLASCARSGNFLFGRSAWGLVILILDIVAVLDILKQPWETSKKLIWMVVIFLLPVVGLIAYYLFSSRQKV